MSQVVEYILKFLEVEIKWPLVVFVLVIIISNKYEESIKDLLKRIKKGSIGNASIEVCEIGMSKEEIESKIDSETSEIKAVTNTNKSRHDYSLAEELAIKYVEKEYLKNVKRNIKLYSSKFNGPLSLDGILVLSSSDKIGIEVKFPYKDFLLPKTMEQIVTQAENSILAGYRYLLIIVYEEKLPIKIVKQIREKLKYMGNYCEIKLFKYSDLNAMNNHAQKVKS